MAEETHKIFHFSPSQHLYKTALKTYKLRDADYSIDAYKRPAAPPIEYPDPHCKAAKRQRKKARLIAERESGVPSVDLDPQLETMIFLENKYTRLIQSALETIHTEDRTKETSMVNKNDGSNTEDSFCWSDTCYQTSTVITTPKLVLLASHDYKKNELVNQVCIAHEPTCVEIAGRRHLVPKCEFIISEFTPFCTMMSASTCRYDLVVIDPPWPNKSVRRGGKYGELDVDRLLRVPMAGMACGYVCMWVTNKKKYHLCVEDLFKSWGIEIVSEVVWLKLTNANRPVFDILDRHRKPYEVCIVGRCDGADVTKVLPRNIVVLSKPSKSHSRKPDIDFVFADVLARDAKKLELFARCAREGWTSWGNETLKFNDLCYYEEVQDGYDTQV